MKRLRKKYIDKRLNWRDPDMPVLRTVLIDGQPVPNKPIPPKAIQEFYARKMDSFTFEPEWRSDETYDLKKKQKSLK